MKESAKQVVMIISSLALLVSCSSSGSKTGLLNSDNGAQPAGQQQTLAGAPPPVNGEWELDYELNGNSFMGKGSFNQSGSALVGAGVDQDGKEWHLDTGQIQGTNVAFSKKYANSTSPPVVYTGELKYLQTPEYTGWAMEGTYTVSTPEGVALSGKWVSNPIAAGAAAPAQ